MFAAISLILVLGGAGIGSLISRRGTTVALGLGKGFVGEPRRHANQSLRWSAFGLVAGLVVALGVSFAGSLGRGVMLAAPVFGVAFLLAVCAGEMTSSPPSAVRRTATIRTRRVRSYLPRPLTGAVGLSTLLLTASMIGATLYGSTDDLGRVGRSLSYSCAQGHIGSRGPWPGWFYAAPLLLVTGIVVSVAFATLVQIVRRNSLDDDPDSEWPTPDDQLRLRSAESVVAATGIAIAIPLMGVSLFGGLALSGVDCLPTVARVVQIAWLAVAPLSLLLIGWSARSLLAAATSVGFGPELSR